MCKVQTRTKLKIQSTRMCKSCLTWKIWFLLCFISTSCNIGVFTVWLCARIHVPFVHCQFPLHCCFCAKVNRLYHFIQFFQSHNIQNAHSKFTAIRVHSYQSAHLKFIAIKVYTPIVGKFPARECYFHFKSNVHSESHKYLVWSHKLKQYPR